MRTPNYIMPVLIALTAASCRSHSEAPLPDDKAILDSIARQVQTTPAQMAGEGEELRLNGKVQADESKLVKVYALVSGKVGPVNVELGDLVQKGQPLAVLRSTEVAGASNDVSLAESNLAMTRKALETTKDLYDGKLATEQDYLNARINYNKAQSELNRARQVASITGGGNAVVTLTAPITGYVIEKNITPNSAVRADNSSDLFAIADLSEVWVLANVYEADMDHIRLGDTVKVNTLAEPDKDYIGRIDKLYDMLDPATRTMKVRVRLPNPGIALKPEMFATVRVSGRSLGAALSIPAQSLVLDNSRNYVVVRNNGKLAVKQVTLLRRTGDQAFVSGLAPGEQVVTNSQVFLYQALTTQ